MAEIILVRNPDILLSDEEKLSARKVMFGVVDGLGVRGQKQWRRFWNALMRLEPGELVTVVTHQARLGWFHRKHMALESRIFAGQEKFEEFEHFRNWMKVGAGFCTWYAGPKGGVIPVPKSISFATLDQTEMEQFHKDAIAFLRSPHALKTLWAHAPENDRADALELILVEFNEQ